MFNFIILSIVLIITVVLPSSNLMSFEGKDGNPPNGSGYVRAIDYGTPSKRTIDAVLAAVGSLECTLVLTPGNWTIDADLKIPSNMVLKMERGAILCISSSKTLTINGPFEAGLFQVFSVSGHGKVVFGSGSVIKVYPEWWGAKTDGKDSLAAFQAAVNTGLKVIASGSYTLDNSSSALMFNNLTTEKAHLEGAHGWDGSKLTFTSTAHPGMQISYTTAKIVSVTIKSLRLSGPGGTTAGNFGIYVPGGAGTVISRMIIDDVRVNSWGDDGIRIQGPTGPVQIRDPYIYNCNGYGIKLAPDAALAATQDVTISGGAIQGTCLGGIAADGTGTSISSFNVIDCDIELNYNTKPAIYLKNVYGGTFLNTTAAALGTMTTGDGVVYAEGSCAGNSFIGLYTRGANGAHNFSFSGMGGNNIVQGGFHYTDDHVNSYFAKVAGGVGNIFMNPSLSPSTYAANHALVYDAGGSANKSICVGISKLLQSTVYTVPQPIMSTVINWSPNRGANIPAGTATVSSFKLSGLLITDMVQISMGTCAGGTAKWFIQAVPEDTDTLAVSLFNGSGSDRAFGTTTVPVHVTVYRK